MKVLMSQSRVTMHAQPVIVFLHVRIQTQDTGVGKRKQTLIKSDVRWQRLRMNTMNTNEYIQKPPVNDGSYRFVVRI